jgi:glycosyltransferase involved in cell wall biosynthesis
MSTKLKIALVGPYPAKACLGEDRIKPGRRSRYVHPAPWIKSLCEGLAELPGLEVYLFVHSRDVSSVQTGAIGQARAVFVPKYEPGHLDPVLGDFTARIQMRPLMKKFNPAVVLGFGTESMYGLLASTFGCPSAIFIQGIVEKLPMDAYGSPAWAHRFLRRNERRAIRRANGVIAENRFAAGWARSINPAIQAVVIPHPVTPDFLTIESDYGPRILFVGAMNSNKRPLMVARAFSRICDRHPAAELVLVGDAGDETGPLREFVKEHNLADRIRMTGPLSREGVMSELAQSRCLALASRMDTSPNVVTEAHAAGLAVVATRTGGIPEMVAEGVDGFLVNIDDEEAMAERLHRLLSDRDMAICMGKAGRERVLTVHAAGDVATRYAGFFQSWLSGSERSQ